MMRFLIMVFAFLALNFSAHAAQVSTAQVALDASKVLRGRFVEQHQVNGTPVQSTGHFVVAPAYGLIWGIEQPVPTTTVVTPNAATQNLGGIVMKLPAKNLRHIFDMVGGALAGDWSKIAQEYTITPVGNPQHWQLLLTPIQAGNPKQAFSQITVGGSSYVESIVMTKLDGSIDSFSFGDENLAALPLSPQEMALFGQN